MKAIPYREIEGKSTGYWALLAVLGLLVALGLGSAYYMEHHGHIVTGMNNQIVWGMPHVFAVFLIVAASGALNVASIGSVFGKTIYKPMAPLSGVLALALLGGGLTSLLLDLGRPDRLIVAATHYNFKSVFAWNVFLYSGFFAIVAAYVWVQLDRTVYKFGKVAGVAAFVWRLLLTTGTGSIFGFLVARQLYDSALLAPMFVIYSFAYGMALFLLVLFAAYGWSGRPLGDAVVNRLKSLLATFVAASLYFTAVFHMTNLYFTKHHGVEQFILLNGGGITTLFWLGQVVIGGILPLAILYSGLGKSRTAIGAASVLVVLGGLAQMYVTIIGGQSYPLVLFPGYDESSSFFDGVVHPYSASLPEFLLGLGGFGIALIIVAVAVKVLRILPESLDNKAVDPSHHK